MVSKLYYGNFQKHFQWKFQPKTVSKLTDNLLFIKLLYSPLLQSRSTSPNHFQKHIQKTQDGQALSLNDAPKIYKNLCFPINNAICCKTNDKFMLIP